MSPHRLWKIALGVVVVAFILVACWRAWPVAPTHRARTASTAVPVAEGPAPTTIGAAPRTAVPDDVVQVSATPSPPQEDAYLRTLWSLHETDKPRALEWARRGDGWYADRGLNAEARHAMQITLLVDLGQMAEARQLARRFIVAHPQSRYRAVVQGVTGIHPRPSGPAALERL